MRASPGDSGQGQNGQNSLGGGGRGGHSLHTGCGKPRGRGCSCCWACTAPTWKAAQRQPTWRPGEACGCPVSVPHGLWNGLLLVSPNSPTFSGQAKVLGEGVCMCVPVVTTHWWYFYSSYLLTPSGFSTLPTATVCHSCRSGFAERPADSLQWRVCPGSPLRSPAPRKI